MIELQILKLYCDRDPHGGYENTPEDIAIMLDLPIEKVMGIIREGSVLAIKRYYFGGDTV